MADQQTDLGDIGARFLAARDSSDVRGLARMITVAENDPRAASQALERLSLTSGQSHVLGVTGPPGVGKSSLVNQMVAELRRREARVAVLAVDPTSPYSGGALLGDRIRMNAHSDDPGVYIRSMATRGILGGLAQAAWLAVRVLTTWGFDWVIVETAGVGQSEIDVVDLADTTILVLSPGLGDDVQVMKAGVMEVADLFVINKADLAGTDRLHGSLKTILSRVANTDDVSADSLPDIHETVATAALGESGVRAVVDDLIARFSSLDESGELDALRRRRYRIEVQRSAYSLLAPEIEREVDRLDDRKDPLSAAYLVVEELFARSSWSSSTVKLHHIGIAVEELGSSLPVFEDLGLELSETEEVAEQKVRVGILPCGDSRIELLSSTDLDGPIAKFIAKRGAGIHHIAFSVGDIEGRLSHLARKGHRLIDETPRVGAGGMKIAFVHPSATGGVLIELCEQPINDDLQMH